MERLVHPNEDVNRSQSSNEVFPTAMHAAALREVEARLPPAVAYLHEKFAARAAAFGDVLKMGRTHLMDAVPVTLGPEFSGYVAQIEHGKARVRDVARGLRDLAIGGTAVGAGPGAPAGFAAQGRERVRLAFPSGSARAGRRSAERDGACCTTTGCT